jgi:WD40 repeat protein
VINWSSDSRRIVTGALDNTIRVFDVETGSLVCGPLTGHTEAPIVLAFGSSSLHNDIDSVVISGAPYLSFYRRSQLSLLLVSLDGTARVWELGTKDFNFTETRSHPKLHKDWVRCLVSLWEIILRLYSDLIRCYFTSPRSYCVRRR